MIFAFTVVANEGQRIDIPDGCILENRLLSGNLNMIVSPISHECIILSNLLMTFVGAVIPFSLTLYHRFVEEGKQNTY